LQWDSHDPIGKQVLQALLKAVDKRQQRLHILCRKMKANDAGMRYNICAIIISMYNRNLM
jgi:hypothetical protein